MTNPKISSKGKHHTRRAADSAMPQSRELEAAISRVSVEMPLSEIMAKLAEHGVRIFHIHGTGAEAIILTGADSGKVASEIYHFIYGD